MKAKIFTFFIFSILLVTAVNALPSDWWGKVEIDGENADGATVEAYIDGNKVDDTTVGAIESGYYLMHIEANEGDKITFKVDGVDVDDDFWSEDENKKLDFNYTNEEPPPELGGDSGTGTSGGGGGGFVYLSVSEEEQGPCVENWKCESWSECSSEGKRECVSGWVDASNCGTEEDLPSSVVSCTPLGGAEIAEEEAEEEVLAGPEEKDEVPGITGAVTGIGSTASWIFLIVLIALIAALLLLLFLRRRKKH